ncbi:MULTISPECIES: cbb3-type cytochrome oxidase assembly protein [unclassified Campylobacter]|uniref:cbb3-type cytochrome oxidase assembly protein n=1 Tax=unclassified Campylobacter TaxID=2593542 RepID=UPI001238127D|nr:MULTISPECIES: cbb3-type cytochrome oxidase assembly protein CcoS [unclassified Campylobacter]KAA6226730.1 cbb3-type cytochrome oxidase assembly protein CcoS [Campylobacter sp. LR196d]KAA6228674.1 cbb3-type cytochrome oxidase assembly protein CcoS [Campylobacter sp. LR185c]KAA6229077.1 cbb3-type cytochrome oxidase assembly protein CcoS [Campylobacter sp. LR286c]KAA6230167.1 cbb3-type cytochrome oxidase assembly protein CcoS [Campylobacter sp. LR291e]KAA6233688.1 cbb3-type cytochrome oxidase 
MNGVIMMMIAVSIVGFFIILTALLWGIRGKQFDDDYKFTTLDDSVEALNDAYNLQKRKEEALKRKKRD